MFKVSNFYESGLPDERYVYCGRQNEKNGLDRSPLCNPYWMRNEDQRDFVCDKFNELFKVEIKKPGSPIHSKCVELYKLHQRLGEVFLVCYCAPKRCHCNTIASFLNRQLVIKQA